MSTESEIVQINNINEEKIITTENNIYSDLMTEIELGTEIENSQLMPEEIKNINNCNQNNVDENETPVLPTEQSSTILSRDVAVSEFFNDKNDEFDNQDIIVSVIENEGIDFKNDTDVVNCTEDYEDKKLLFEEEDECPEEDEDVECEQDGDVQSAENLAGEDDQYEITNEDESLNRMHVMEDVDEGCNLSGTLPSSPGHAEQRTTTKEDPTQEVTEPQSPIAITNGLSPNSQSDGDQNQPTSHKSTTEKEDGEISKKNNCSRQKNKRKNEENQTNEDSNSNDSENSVGKSREDEEICPAKKLRTQIQQQYITHDKILTDYLESTGCNTLDDFQCQSEQLLAEIRTLNELAREKEREWNNILHVKKVKEELLLRLQRKRQILLLNSEKVEDDDLSNENHSFDVENKKESKLNNGLMMVPIVSSSPANLSKNQTKNHQPNQTKHRPILPKPNFNNNHQTNLLLDPNESKTGRQGPILDVRSIIADYRQRHPETVPRRGRRLRSVLNNNFSDSMVTTSAKSGSIINLTNQILGSGAQVRHGDVSNELGLLLSSMDAANKHQDSRPSSADSSSIVNNEQTMSFKDVLVQFARLSQSERQELQAAAAASLAGNTNKPLYPEVTLHAVNNQTNNIPASNTNASLLHGILTKNQTKADSSKPATFSPTLARLLTAPERVTNTNAQAVYNAAAAALNSGVSISDLLTTTNTKGDEEAEDSTDRLVIDEGGQDSAENRQRGTDTGSDAGDDVPQCQGCNQKSAQFVCAGCGNQWYCSRDCQVAAWDEHSEVCSG